MNMMTLTTSVNSSYNPNMNGITMPHNLIQIDYDKKYIRDDIQKKLQDLFGEYKKFSPDMVAEVEFYPPAVKMTFKDGTVTTASAKDGDAYDPEMGMIMCINKYVWKGSGYNNFFRKWIKQDEERKAMIQAQKDKEEKAKERAEKRRKKNAERIARKKAAEREEAIQIQVEAYKRAMASGDIREA